MELHNHHQLFRQLLYNLQNYLLLFLFLPILDGTYNIFRSSVPTQNEENQANTMFTKNEVTFDFSWHTGEVMDAHKFFANDCEACHTKPFIMVEDQACLTCHQETHAHFDVVQFTNPDLNSTRCASCHTDHQGPEPLRASQQALCSDCHTNLEAKAEGTKLINASDFGLNHPQFKPTVWVDASAGKQARISLDETPKENSNLKTLDFLKEVNDYGVSRLIYTDINKDGMKTSPNFEGTEKIANTSNFPVIISGGVSSIEDIKKAKELNNKNIEGIIVGKAIYDGDIKLEDLAKEIDA